MLPHTVAPTRPFADAETSTREVLSHWRTAGIPYCALRQAPEQESQTGDLDVLVDEAWIDRFRHLLEEQGFVGGPSRSPFKMVMLRYQQGQLLCLDIHWKAAQYRRRVHGCAAYALAPGRVRRVVSSLDRR